MKKLFTKKRLIISLGLLFLITAIPIISVISIITHPQNSLADVSPLPYYKSTTTVTMSDIVSKIGDSTYGSSTVVNLSDKTYFIPNKTSKEWNAFASNTPPYVSASTCPDDICEATNGENATNCPHDCSSIGSYCGDGVCSNSLVVVHHDPPLSIPEHQRVCTQKTRGWLWIPIVAVIALISDNTTYTTCRDVYNDVLVYDTEETKGEVWNATNTLQVSCEDDCARPSGTGCGVCGYDASGNICPNYCSNRALNFVNCVYESAVYVNPNATQLEMKDSPSSIAINNTPIKKYLTASEASAVTSIAGTTGFSYTIPPYYTCDFGDTTNNSSYLCPAGYVCSVTGGLKPGTTLTSLFNAAWLTTNHYTSADLEKPCDAGYFCPLGSYFEHICPYNTYSTGGAATCTGCPLGTGTGAMSTSADFCMPQPTTGSGACNSTMNPSNAPADCPDANQVATGNWNGKGDGKCTGQESMANDPLDCHCGDKVCDYGETYFSCMQDCYGFDNICGTSVSTYIASTSQWTTTKYQETNKADSYGNWVTNKACQYLNDNDVCGDGTCATSTEGYNTNLGKIVCPLDCHCGDGTCDSWLGETHASCPADCLCGNGKCDSTQGEYYSNCMLDCHCGDGKCETYDATPGESTDTYSENVSSCPGDCRCGDGICASDEKDSGSHPCPQDCDVSCNNNGECEPELGESKLGKCVDCGYRGTATPATGSGKTTLTAEQ